MATQSDTECGIREGSSSSKRSWLSVVGAVVVLSAALVATFVFRSNDADVRIEREHNIELPESAVELQALGDASGTWMSVIGIDRGASSILVIDRTDLDELFGQFEETDFPFGELDGPPAPGNAIYRPDSVPWPEDAEIERALFTVDPPNNADFAQINAYSMEDPNLIGIWIYSDWN